MTHLFVFSALLDPTWIQRREKEVAEQNEKEQVYEPGIYLFGFFLQY